MPSHVWRTAPKAIRGGSIATAFDYEFANQMPITHDREYTESETEIAWGFFNNS